MVRVVLLGVLLISLIVVPGSAQPRGADLSLGIFAGSCDDPLSTPEAPLTLPVLPSGEAVGSAEAHPVATSFTTVPLSLAAILGADHVVAVVPAGDEEPAACGAVGGPLTLAGAVAIELREEGSSGLSGIAYLAPSSSDAGQTDVSLFLAGLGTATIESAAATEVAALMADATATQESGGAPAVTPTEPASATATVAPTASAAAMETYVSPTWGFALTYDPTVWRIGDEPATQGNVDTIGFSTFGTDVLLGGFPYTGDALACAADLTAGMTQQSDVVSSQPLVVDGAPVAGGDAHDAFQAVVLTRTKADGGTMDQAFYARCIELIPGSAMVGIQQWAAAAVYDVAARQREELLAGLILP